MRSAFPALAGILAAGAAGAAFAQGGQYTVTIRPGTPAGYQETSVSRATVGPATIRLWASTALDPDCSAHLPGPTLTVLEPPAHGAARISNEPGFLAAFPPGNPRSACNSRKVPGNQAFYTAAAGYKGHDHVVLQATNPDGGAVRRINVDIDVR